MIVEFVGLPGVGKSTFARALAKESEFRLVTVKGTKEILLLNVIAFLRHPIDTTRRFFITFCELGPRVLWYEKFVNLFLVANAKYEKARRYRHAIIDQGYLQNYISLFESQEKREVYERVFALFSVADIAIFFDIPEAERQRRISERGYGTRMGMSPEYQREREKAMQSGAAYVRSVWSPLNAEIALKCPMTLAAVTDEETSSEVMEILTMRPGTAREELVHDAPRMIVFAINARMPTEKAHGLQIVRTAEALNKEGVRTMLLVPDRRNPIDKSIEEFYGTRMPISMKRLWCLDLFGKVAPGLAHRIIAMTFALSLARTALSPRATYITRNPEIVWVLSRRGFSVFYEAHTAPARYRVVFRFLLKRVAGIMTNSEGTKEAIMRVIDKPIKVIRNGVDLEQFSYPRSKSDLRRTFGIPHERHVVMYLGGFFAWKGVGTLIDAWKERGSTDDLLVLVGGTMDDIERLGKTDVFSPMKHRILLFPHQPASLVPDILAIADVLVLPNAPITEESIRHTSPIKLFEYMASGVPIIASDLPAIREVVDEESVLFFRAGDARSLARAIDAILERPDDAATKAAYAKALAGSYGWDVRARTVLEFTKGVATKRPQI